MTVHRLTIRPRGDDPTAHATLTTIRLLGLADPAMTSLTRADVLFFDGELSAADLDALHARLVDPLLAEGTWDEPAEDRRAVEVTVVPGVTDPRAEAALLLAHRMGLAVGQVATGRRYELHGDVAPAARDAIADAVLANEVIERWHVDRIDAAFPPHDGAPPPAEIVPVRGLDTDQLVALNVERRLSLDPAELLAVQAHYDSIGRDPTDVEIETIAQTWSEHCSHKTFRARLVGPDGERPRTLLQQLRDSTESIAAPFVRSAFVGNAGIVSFSPGTTLAVKAETHNHPSAIEPFGGANTGVGGVIRDVMGAAHRPIAVTDILCFGPTDLPASELPAGVHHPSLIEHGVVAGVADYGNKIGLPTVAGAVLYDPGYTSNPLVFCGAIGAAPDRPLLDGPHPGDRVIVLGGRTGRDGLRGATFSSATMDATTGEVAGASVQIGDPIVEKLLIDVLDETHHLITAITDCGAGGLSSAVGEMAETTGADVELTAVPLKYPGLAPWEIWLSEAQERMVVSAAPDQVEALRAACEHHGVELSDIGEFTGTGRLVVRMAGTPVLDMDTGFLHDGRPQRTMTFEPAVPVRDAGPERHCDDPSAMLLALLGHPNIASKEAIVRRYDHEIRGATLVRPFVGWAGDGPADGVVLAEPADTHGLAVGLGVNPWQGVHDPERMALAAVDEAMRNVVAVGADPERVVLLDNFSWGDPRRPSTLGELMAAVDGCCAAAGAHGAPFVSGKDSLNNEYVTGDGTRRSVPPTLVITAIAHVPDAERVVTPDLKQAGNLLYVVGSTGPDWAGSHFDLVQGEPRRPGTVGLAGEGAPARYRTLHRAILAGLVRSCHDVSEGGIAVAIAEMCLGGGLGVRVASGPDPFSETPGRFVVEVRPDDRTAFEALWAGIDEIVALGEVDDSDRMCYLDIDVALTDLRAAWGPR